MTTRRMTLRLAARGGAPSPWRRSNRSRGASRRTSRRRSRPYRTTGDRLSRLDTALVGKGVFTKEIDEALLDGRCDVGVHSLKDLPSELPEGLVLAAVPAREDPSDVLISPSAASRTCRRRARRDGKPRRRAQLLAARPDLTVTDARGNVDTRIRRLGGGRWDAIVLARAGLARLGRLDEVCDVFPPEMMLPAIGQGRSRSSRAPDDAPTARAARDPGRPDLASRDRGAPNERSCCDSRRVPGAGRRAGATRRRLADADGRRLLAGRPPGPAREETRSRPARRGIDRRARRGGCWRGGPRGFSRRTRP